MAMKYVQSVREDKISLFTKDSFTERKGLLVQKLSGNVRTTIVGEDVVKVWCCETEYSNLTAAYCTRICNLKLRSLCVCVCVCVQIYVYVKTNQQSKRFCSKYLRL